MTIYEAIGMAWVVFTSALATVALGYFCWKGVSSAWRQRERGQTEEILDIRRAWGGSVFDRAGGKDGR